MDGDAIIHAIWEVADGEPSHRRGSTKNEMKSAMKEILEGEGYFVLEDDKELREKALEETDLVEPTE